MCYRGILCSCSRLSPPALSSAQDSEAISQTVSAVDNLVAGGCANDTLDTGSGIIDTMVAGVTEVGLGEGTADKMASAIGAMVSQGETQAAAIAAVSPPPIRRRLQVAVNGTDGGVTYVTVVDTSTPLTESELALQQTARRNAQLVNSTAGLSGAIGNGLIAGEEPQTVTSPGLTMSASKEDPCDAAASSANQQVPALDNGVSGSFSVPPGSMCKEEEGNRRSRRLQRGRRRLSGSSAGCASGADDDSVQVAVSMFKVRVPHSVPSNLTPHRARPG